ncbi:MAG: hypothetical protein ACK2UU_05860, partial [Anaerolineae bacterium]
GRSPAGQAWGYHASVLPSLYSPNGRLFGSLAIFFTCVMSCAKHRGIETGHPTCIPKLIQATGLSLLERKFRDY